MTSAPTGDDKAKVTHRLSQARSVTDRDELLRLAVDLGRIGIYETDFELNETRFSPELCSILGLWPGTRMSSERAVLLFHEEDRLAVQQSLDAAENGPDKGKWSGVHRVVRPDGQVRWIAIQGRRFYRDGARTAQERTAPATCPRGGPDRHLRSRHVNARRPHRCAGSPAPRASGRN